MPVKYRSEVPPVRKSPSWSAYDQRKGIEPPSWHGTLVEDKLDGAGTYYRRNRVYDPGTGRFTQEDPIGLAGGMNLYGFANGDPVNFSDPFGLFGCKGRHDSTCSGALASAGFFDPIALLAGGIAGGIRGLGVRLFGRAAAADALAVSAGEVGFSASGVAGAVAEATGGVVGQLAKSEGSKVTLEVGRRAVVARIKSSGDFRVSIEGLGSLTREGILSSDRAATHLSGATAEEVTRLLQRAVDLLRVPRQ
jgi:RHS repeat-associated protein